MTSNPICKDCEPSVLIVENSARDRDDFAEMITLWGGCPVIATGVGPKLFEDAIAKNNDYQCRVALVDMRLLDDSNKADRSGFELIKQLEPAKTIIVTGYADYSAARDAMGAMYGAVDFVGKEEGSGRLLGALQKALHKSACACPAKDQIKWPRGLSSGEVFARLMPGSKEADGQSDQLLTRLFGDTPVHLRPLSRSVKSISPTPYRRSIVLLTEINKPEPLVVKFAAKGHIEKEFAAYVDHIDGYLGQNRYAQIVDHKSDWNLGALIYRFMGSSIERMRLFSEFYPKVGLTEIGAALVHVFETWRTHYQKPNFSTRTLYELYDEAWNNKWSLRLEESKDRHELNPPTKLAHYKLENPVRWALDYGQHSSPDNNRVAVTHGDLHGDNIYVDGDNKTWQSDFERSGWGPIFRDFIELEIDILTRLLPYKHADLPDYFSLVVNLLSDAPRAEKQCFKAGSAMHKAFESALIIRQRADDIVGLNQDRESYHWGLLFTSLFRATSILKQIDQGNYVPTLIPLQI